jgi:D-alanyl-D-alanine carboxypeptidase
MNGIGKPIAKNKRRKPHFFFGMIKLCIIFAIFIFLTLPIQKVLIKGTESLPTQNEPAASQTQEKNIIVKQSNNTDLSSINDNKDWMLMLVNGENPLPNNYSPKLKKLKNGLQFDERAIDQLNAMISDAQAQGLSPIVCSAYRTIEKQKTLFNNQVYKYLAKGFSQEQAEIEARKYVAYPGTSEHSLGVAADIVSANYQLLDEKQADTQEIKWLIKHCSEYGFILRYPKDKVDITGVEYEPWHFRYVGIQAAQEIMKGGLCLEKYLVNIGEK